MEIKASELWRVVAQNNTDSCPSDDTWYDRETALEICVEHNRETSFFGYTVQSLEEAIREWGDACAFNAQVD